MSGILAAAMLAVVPSVQHMKGPFPIMSTPYFEDGSIDCEALKREARFVQASGCPGCIWGQSNDAIDLLTTEEKFRCFEACASAVEGLDITLALGADGTNTAELVEIAAEIERVAARHPTARIAMISRPPDDVRSQEDIEKAWDALATVAKRPVIFQTYGTKQTPTPEVALLVRLAERHPAIYGFIKEEASGFGAVERMLEENRHRPPLKTLMAGWGAWQMLMQVRQCGCEGLVTERCAYAPVLGAFWRDYVRGERGFRLAESFAMFRLLCDQKNFPGGLRGYSLYLLEKEGVFRNRLSRQYLNADVKDAGSFGAGREWKLVDVKLNDLQKKELDLLYRDMMDFVRSRGPFARESVVFVGAHPDDLAGEIGTALRLRERYDIHVIDFTRGERGCGEEKFRSGWTKATRTKEEEAVCAAIGAKLHWIEEVDGEAFACREACERLAAVLREVKPRAVITHWPVDVHLDHVMTGAATLKAIRLAGIDPEIYFHEQDHQSRAFAPTVSVDVTGVEAEKERIIRLYACQDGERIAQNKRLAGDFRGRSGLRPGSFCEAYCAYPGSVKGLGVLAGLSVPGESVQAPR